MKAILGFILGALLLVSPVIVPDLQASQISAPKGFDRKVYNASFALYASSQEAGVELPRFICTVTAYQKFQNGYLFLGAGHCTSAGGDLPTDMKFYVSPTIDGPLYSVQLLAANVNESLDYAVYYMSPKISESIGSKIETLNLGDEGSLKIGDKVVDTNFSLGLAKEVSHGVVSTEIVKSGEMQGFYGVDMFDSHGASGSSVVDEHSKKVVGLVIAGVDGATLPTWVEPISTVKSELGKLDYKKLIEHPESPNVQTPQSDRKAPVWY